MGITHRFLVRLFLVLYLEAFILGCASGEIAPEDAGVEETTDAGSEWNKQEFDGFIWLDESPDSGDFVESGEPVLVLDGKDSGGVSECSPKWVDLGQCDCSPNPCQSCQGKKPQTDGCGNEKIVDCVLPAIGCGTTCCGGNCCTVGQWCDGQACSAATPYQQEFSLPWNFKKIFSPADIPLPSSAPADAYIKGIYSTSVIQIGTIDYMFFGISLYCSNSTVARDSIGLAQSTNDFDWQFVKYILEPDPSSCFKPRDQWDDPVFTYQVNDPAAYLDPSDPNTVLVFYTSVKSNHDNYGHIGLAKFDRQFNLVSRNDYFLLGTDVLGGAGYSRPTVYWLAPEGPRLFFDSTWIGVNKIGSVALDNVTQLNSPTVRDESTPGIDIDIPNLGTGKTLLLSGGSWARSRLSANDPWSPSWTFTPLSGQGWDRDGQGSPWLFLDDSCKARLYMSGTLLNEAKTDYVEINIGMAWPVDDREFHFEACQPCTTMSAPVQTHPLQDESVPLGEPLALTWTLSDYGNRPLSQTLCVSSNQTSCDLVWVTLPPSVTLFTFIPLAIDNFVSWQLTAKNTCGMSQGAQVGAFLVE